MHVRNLRFCLGVEGKVKSKMCLDMRRYQKFYEAEKNARNGNLPLIHAFLGKKVRVKISNSLEVEGILIRYQLQKDKDEHKPSLLILKDEDSFHFVRGNWITISEVKK
jgi:hypothetical protein